MDLDDIIISCTPLPGPINHQDLCADLLTTHPIAGIFHYIEGFCPSSDSSESFRTFLSEIEWQLPKVVFDWTAR